MIQYTGELLLLASALNSLQGKKSDEIPAGESQVGRPVKHPFVSRNCLVYSLQFLHRRNPTKRERIEFSVLFCLILFYIGVWASQVALVVKNLPANAEDARVYSVVTPF